jgi:acyl-CoA thioester hydrolase
MPTQNPHILPVRVYYEDTDAGGVVYHANYLKFCERGRTDFLRVLGIKQSEMPDLLFVVRRMTCDFIKSARLDDLLEVETRFVERGGARLELEQTVKRAGEIIFQAKVTAALIDDHGRPRRLPPELEKLLP